MREASWKILMEIGVMYLSFENKAGCPGTPLSL